MANTENYNFKKIVGTEYLSVDHQNDNWDANDNLLKSLETGQSATQILEKLKTVDGTDSGLDAGLLGGQLPAYYTDILARLGYTPLDEDFYTAADVLAKLLTVDGSGSYLDADLLDGQHGSYYAPKNSPTFTGTPAAPTPSTSTNSTQIATTAYVRAQDIKGQVTVTNASWVASGNTKFPFKKDVAITNVVASDKPVSFDFTLGTYEIAEAAGITYLECYAGGVTLYATATPTGSVTADYVIRKA